MRHKRTIFIGGFHSTSEGELKAKPLHFLFIFIYPPLNFREKEGVT
jgi:hypothetical protein